MKTKKKEFKLLHQEKEKFKELYKILIHTCFFSGRNGIIFRKTDKTFTIVIFYHKIELILI